MPITLDGTSGITTPGLINTGTETVVNLTTTGNTTLGDASTDTLNVGNGDLVKDSSGRVGIGTTSPAQTLHVKTSTSATPITLGVLSNATGLPALSFNGAYASTTMAGIYGNGATASNLYYTVPASQNHFFGIADATKMTLDASGNLGLGVTPSAWGSGFSVLQLESKAALIGNNGATYLGNNWYSNVGSKYIGTGLAALYAQSVGAHTWYNAASGTAGNPISFTQAMTLNASGNLGIGTTSPASRLEIKDTTNNTALTVTSSFEASLQLVNGGGSEVSVINAGGSNILSLRTANNEKARIDSSGNLLVGTTSGSYHTLAKDIAGNFATEIRNSNANPYGLYIRYSGAAPNGSVNEFLYVGDTVGQKMSIRSNGGIANYSASNVNLSDRREKTNFAPAGDYLSKICAIPVQTFNYIDQNMEEDGGLTLGVVAQDVQAVAPELVMESNWAGKDEEPKMRLGIYQTDLQYALMKCIQEQQALITQLQADVAALKGGNP